MKNNLLCVKQNGWSDEMSYAVNLAVCAKDPWMGSANPLADERGHANFRDVAYSLRAALIILLRKWNAGKRTLRDIITSWAPPDDPRGSIPGNTRNNPDEYARYVAERMHLQCGIDSPLCLFTEAGDVDRLDHVVKMVMAMDHYETPSRDATGEDLLQGILGYRKYNRGQVRDSV